jgi:uncharacterized delta-60 repeat protein
VPWSELKSPGPDHMKTIRIIVVGALAVVLLVVLFYRGATKRASDVAAAVPDPTPQPQTSEVANTPGPSVPKGHVEHQNPMAAFSAWAERFSSATFDEKEQLVSEGESLAEWRREALEELIQTDPRQALAAMVPYDLRKQLPPSVQSLLETPVSGRGNFEVLAVHGSEEDTIQGSMYRQLELDGRQYNAYVYGWRSAQRSGRDIPFHGMSLGDKLALDVDVVRVLSRVEATDVLAAKSDEIPWAEPDSRQENSDREPVVVAVGRKLAKVASTAEAIDLNRRLTAVEMSEAALDTSLEASSFFFFGPGSQGTKKLLYIRINFPDDPREPASESRANSMMSEVNQFFTDSSYNTLNISATITPVLTLPQPKEFYRRPTNTFFGGSFGTLLDDAHEAARLAGYLSSDYDLEMVHAMPVPGFPTGGLSVVGGRNNLLQNAGSGTIARALGFNFGLYYANAWNSRNEPRNNIPPNPRSPNANYPIDSDSRIGHDGINAPGRSDQEGDLFDAMGDGNGAFPRSHFNIISKYQLGWLPSHALRGISTSGTNRIYAYDSPERVEGRLYGLVVRKDSRRDYWVSFRHLWTNNLWLRDGVELHWPSFGPYEGQGGIGSTDLFDTTPGSAAGMNDAALVVGRTFQDDEAQVYITPTEKGGVGREQWVDVVVNKGPFPTNRPPSLNLTASALNVQPNTVVTFTANAADPDFDKLAYYWEYSDQTLGTNTAVISRTFTTNGHYVVRCEVSDMKGGKTIRHLLITVGTPSTFLMSGRVFDSDNQPLAGVRIQNGVSGSGYRVAFTDSDGAYTIPNIVPGDYANRAFLYGYRTEPLTFFNPVTIAAGNAVNLDHVAFPVTKVSVLFGNDVDEDEGSGTFIVSRTGDTSSELAVPYILAGRATRGQDFQPPTTNVVIIPAGQSSVFFNLQPIDDSISEGAESIIMTLQTLGRMERVSTILTNTGSTNEIITITNVVNFPGYELIIENGSYSWYQTYPFYVAAPAEATVNIRDNEPPAPPAVSFGVSQFVSTGIAFESGNGSTAVYVSRTGDLSQPVTVYYSLSGTATNGADYNRLPGRVTIPAEREFAVIPIVPINDSLVEGAETVVLNILPDPGYTGAGSASVTIIDDDLPLVTLSSPDTLATEAGATRGTFRFQRSGDLSQPLEVFFQVAGGSATEGVDFATLARSAVIPAGRTSIDVPLIPIPDALAEGNETVTLIVADATTYNIGSPNTATVTIREQAVAVVTLAVTDATAGEPADTGVFTLTRTGLATDSLTVNFAVGGTASPADYAAIGTNVVFAAGSSTATITIAPIEDDYHETNETVIVQLLPSPGYDLGATTQGEVTIGWNDGNNLPEVSFALQRAAVPESGGRSAQVMVQLSAEITGTNRAPVKVQWRVVGGSATRGTDYTLESSGYLTFDIRQSLSQIINIPIQSDSLIEPTENIVLGLFDPDLFVTNYVTVTNGTIVSTNEVISRFPTNAFLGSFQTHTLSIIDDDLSVVSLNVVDSEAFETGQDPGSFVISRSGSTNQPQTVFFAVGGSAAQGSDYTAIGNSVVIPAGAQSVTLFLQPKDDPEEELDENAIVTLVAAPGAQLGNTFGGITIHDNDGTVQFLTPVYQVSENAGQALISVVRTRDTNRAGRVEYQIFEGSATRGSDYLATNGVLDFASGEVLKNISIQILDDTIVEPDETVLLVLTNATGGVPIGGQRTATLFINNDDTAFEFSTNAFAVYENSGTASVIVQRAGLLDVQSSVRFSALTNSASAPADFTLITNQLLTFGIGETSRVVTVAIQNDTLFEGDETISLSLGSPSTNTLLGPISNATLRIVDDECSLAFSSPTYSTNEFAQFVTLVVTRTGGTVNPVFVDIATGDGTASNTLDYVAQQGRLQFDGDGFVLRPDGSGQVDFRPGETSKVVQIALLDDILGEANETFNVRLSNAGTTAANTPVGSTVIGRNGTASNAVVTIIDNESPGKVDYEYNPGAGANGPVHALTLQSERTVFGGAFTSVDNANFTRIARLQVSGGIDLSFNSGAGANGDVLAVAAQPDGRIYIGGSFGTVDNTPRGRIARLNADGSHDAFAFNPPSGANSTVRAIAVQSNGKIVIGGDFTQVNGVARTRLARLNDNGTLDGAFAPAIDGAVHAVAVQTDGKIVIGGAFVDVSGKPRGHVARLNTDGSLDETFDPGLGADGNVYALGLAPGGKVVIGGAFTSFDNTGRLRIARLTSDGALDTDFNVGAGANSNVLAIAVNVTGRIVIGGEFTAVDGVARGRLARLRASGALDTGFDPGAGANAAIRTVALQSDTAILIGGDFTLIDGVPRNRIARIHGDERANTVTVDLANSSITAIENAGPAQVNVLRIGNTNLDFTVSLVVTNGPGPNGATAGSDFVATNLSLHFSPGDVSRFVNIPILDDTQIETDEIISVYFTNASANLDLAGSSSGTITIVDNEQSFRFLNDQYGVSESEPFAGITVVREGLRNGTVSVQLSASDGSAISPGDFLATNIVLTFTNNEARKTIQLPIVQDRIQEPMETVALALSNPVGGGLGTPSSALLYITDDVIPGSVDVTFNPGVGASGRVRSIAMAPDGKVVLGGSFTNFDNAPRKYLARLNADGSHDLTFNPGIGPNSVVLAVSTLSDGRVILGGGFTSYNSNTVYRRVARLGTSGALDLNFNQSSGFNAAVNAVASQSNDRVVAGGGFNQPSRGVTQLRLDGSVDTSFDPGAGANGPVHAVITTTNGEVFIGGSFTMVGGQLGPDGISTRCVARLRPGTGVSAQTTFDSGFAITAITNGTVFAVALQSDGKVLAGGDFYLNTSSAKVNIARFNPDGSLDSSFDAGAGPNGPVYAVGVQQNGRVVVGGDFTRFDGYTRNRYARLQTTGVLDLGFNPGLGADGAVYSLLTLSDGNVLIAGDFQNVNGIARRGIARVRSDDGDIRIARVRHLGVEARITVSCSPGISYVLETSADLLNWSGFRTNAALGSELEFVDPSVGATNQKFYRVRQAGF